MKQTSVLVLLLVMVLLIGGAWILYENYESGYHPDVLTPVTPDDTTAPAEDSAPAEDTTDPDTIKAPGFTVQDGDGNAVSLTDMLGKPVIVNLWASWCPPCKAEMPDFETAYREYGDTIHFMMVNMTDGYQETVEKAKAFIADTGYTFPVYFDTESEAAIAYNATSIPATYFIDAEGNLVVYARGMLDAANLQKGIDMLLDTLE
jgi:thiol-disulfide isomerase/thioredoxin